MTFWNGGGWAWWQASLMWIAMIAFWGLLIWLAYTLITRAMRGPDTTGRGARQSADARRILDERLARGEIDAEEYQRLRDLIAEGTGGGAGAGAGRGEGPGGAVPGRAAPRAAGRAGASNG